MEDDNINWTDEDTIRVHQIYNDSLPSSKKVKIEYLDLLGDKREINLVRKYVLFDPEEVESMKVRKIIALCSTSQEELDLLEVQGFEVFWKVFTAHHCVSYNELNRIVEKSSRLVDQAVNETKEKTFNDWIDDIFRNPRHNDDFDL